MGNRYSRLVIFRVEFFRRAIVKWRIFESNFQSTRHFYLAERRDVEQEISRDRVEIFYQHRRENLEKTNWVRLTMSVIGTEW